MIYLRCAFTLAYKVFVVFPLNLAATLMIIGLIFYTLVVTALGSTPRGVANWLARKPWREWCER
jgi:hypothetical protein